MENIRVYGIDVNNTELQNLEFITNEDWKAIAEDNGLIWTLSGFAYQFNNSMIDTDSILIRFIDIN